MQTRRAFIAAVAGTATLAATATIASPTSASPVGDIKSLPDTLALPTGFFPEGITTGNGPYAYVTSLTNGDVYQLNLYTGSGRVLTAGPGTASVGIKIDTQGRLFVVGAAMVTVINSYTGKVLARYQVGDANSFLNDVVLTPQGAFVTDSLVPVLYKLPFGRSGQLPAQGDVVSIPLGGDVVYEAGFNVNGIERTPDGKALLIVKSNSGQLFRVDPVSGVGTEVDLGGDNLVGGDGLLLDGRTMYAVQNTTIQALATVRLNTQGTAGRLVQQRTDPRFDAPTTVARFGNRLYIPNARFGIPSPQTAEFNVVAVQR